MHINPDNLGLAIASIGAILCMHLAAVSLGLAPRIFRAIDTRTTYRGASKHTRAYYFCNVRFYSRNV